MLDYRRFAIQSSSIGIIYRKLMGICKAYIALNEYCEFANFDLNDIKSSLYSAFHNIFLPLYIPCPSYKN